MRVWHIIMGDQWYESHMATPLGMFGGVWYPAIPFSFFRNSLSHDMYIIIFTTKPARTIPS